MLSLRTPVVKTKQIKHWEELDKVGRDVAAMNSCTYRFFAEFAIKKRYFCFGTIMAMSKHTKFLLRVSIR